MPKYHEVPATSGQVGEIAGALIRWEMVYRNLLGLNRKPDLSQVRIPEKPKRVGLVRLIVVASELVEWTEDHPLQGVQEILKEHFPCWQYTNDLDEAISVNDRDPRNGSYAIWVRDVHEADKEFANKSANDLKVKNHTGITILERQLFEADYFFEKGEHLDRQKSITLCSGSRYRGSRVPSARWYGSGFGVRWYSPSSRHPGLRSRRVWA